MNSIGSPASRYGLVYAVFIWDSFAEITVTTKLLMNTWFLSSYFFMAKRGATAMNYVKEFYDHYDEDGRLLRKSRKPEYLLTMEYIETYLFDGAKILEIGAGTGR